MLYIYHSSRDQGFVCRMMNMRIHHTTKHEWKHISNSAPSRAGGVFDLSLPASTAVYSVHVCEYDEAAFIRRFFGTATAYRRDDTGNTNTCTSLIRTCSRCVLVRFFYVRIRPAALMAARDDPAGATKLWRLGDALSLFLPFTAAASTLSRGFSPWVSAHSPLLRRRYLLQ